MSKFLVWGVSAAPTKHSVHVEEGASQTAGELSFDTPCNEDEIVPAAVSVKIRRSHRARAVIIWVRRVGVMMVVVR